MIKLFPSAVDAQMKLLRRAIRRDTNERSTDNDSRAVGAAARMEHLTARLVILKRASRVISRNFFFGSLWLKSFTACV